jgi:hypothetical protein
LKKEIAMKSLKTILLVSVLFLFAAVISHAQDVTQTYNISCSGLSCGQVTFEATPSTQVWAWSSGGYEGKLHTDEDPEKQWWGVTYTIYCDIQVWDPVEEKLVWKEVELGTATYIPFIDLFISLSFPDLAKIGVPPNYTLTRANLPPGDGDMDNPFIVMINYIMDSGV